ncbi:DUF502 domain-containing protein [Candidatus Sumerlaeota bacterium]|nr:DUF502 domain-containing protein [Candidatus Sumerlaeota bacterium]
MIHRTMSSIKNHLLTGVILLIPITVTYIGLKTLFTFLVHIFNPMVEFLFQEITLPPSVEFAIALFMTVFVLYLVGFFSRLIAVKRLISWGENILTRIPVARFIYLTTKQVLDAMRLMKERSLNKVVLVEYPREGIRSFAFVTGKMKIKGEQGKELVNIFIPSTPNPTTGYFLMLPADQVWDVDISIEEVSKIIISGGLLSTDELRIFPYKPPVDGEK